MFFGHNLLTWRVGLNVFYLLFHTKKTGERNHINSEWQVFTFLLSHFGLLYFHSLFKYARHPVELSLIFKTRTYWFLIKTNWTIQQNLSLTFLAVQHYFLSCFLFSLAVSLFPSLSFSLVLFSCIQRLHLSILVGKSWNNVFVHASEKLFQILSNILYHYS